MLDTIQSFLSVRFIKFCTVGASGVAVNLIFLAFFSDVMAIQVNVALALAIEISINSNFIINELWTFRDRRKSGGKLRRWIKFHLVALIGGTIQWIVFIGCNLLLCIFLIENDNYFADAYQFSFFEKYLIRPIIDPPEVGNWKYLSQLLGIGAATFWNYIVNLYWTWARKEEAADS